MISENAKRSSNAFMRQGQTSAPAFGADPRMDAKGVVAVPPKDEKY